MIGFLSRSIPRRILASLVAIYFATYVATAIVVYSGVRASIVESNTDALHQLAELKYDRLTNVLDAWATDVTAWSQLEVMNDLVSGDIDKRVARTLEDLKQLYGLGGEIYAFDTADKLVASSRVGRSDPADVFLPAAWKTQETGLILRDKHADPMTSSQIIVLETPIFGRFEKDYRIGTLVLAYPWSAIEGLLFPGDTGTVLIETGDAPRVLAANPSSVTEHLVVRPGEVEIAGALLAGRSTPRSGLFSHWQVQALQQTRVVTHSLRRVGLELVFLGALLAVPIVALGRWLSNRLTAPVMELTRVVREIADTDKLDARVPVSSSDELGTLARSFNRMTENLQLATKERERFVRDLEAMNQTLESKVAGRTEELEAAIQAQHRLIGDISHEIKSPLARLDVALGLARRLADRLASKQFDRMEREIGNISALASELLTLARLDTAPMAVDFAPLDLAGLVEEIVADATFEAPHRQADIRLQLLDRAIVVSGNSDLLRRAIENVVRNAVFYTAGKTPVAITVSQTTLDRAVIEVRDEGPGVPEEALAHLFEPFYRVDEARARKTGGAGVGLAICQRVVALHGGSVSAKANRPTGLIVRIEIAIGRRSG
jgi:signal transduction histidine kinase